MSWCTGTLLAQCLTQPLLTYCWLFTCDTCVSNIAAGLQVSLSIALPL